MSVVSAVGQHTPQTACEMDRVLGADLHALRLLRVAYALGAQKRFNTIDRCRLADGVIGAFRETLPTRGAI